MIVALILYQRQLAVTTTTTGLCLYSIAAKEVVEKEIYWATANRRLDQIKAEVQQSEAVYLYTMGRGCAALPLTKLLVPERSTDY